MIIDTRKLDLLITAINNMQHSAQKGYVKLPEMTAKEYAALKIQLQEHLNDIIPRPTSLEHHGG